MNPDLSQMGNIGKKIKIKWAFSQLMFWLVIAENGTTDVIHNFNNGSVLFQCGNEPGIGEELLSEPERAKWNSLVVNFNARGRPYRCVSKCHGMHKERSSRINQERLNPRNPCRPFFF